MGGNDESHLCSYVSTDCVDGYTHSDMLADAVDYEAESWSLAVEHKFCKKHDKRAVKRQDVIFGEQILNGERKRHFIKPPET